MNTSDIGPTEALWLSYCEVKGKLEEAQAQLKDAQGEIRALRATEAGLRERVEELERCVSMFLEADVYADGEGLVQIANADTASCITAVNCARALLEQKP